MPDTDDDDVPADTKTVRKLRHEAAGLRVRLKEAEADVERLVTQNAAMQHAEVERIAGEHLVDAQDIWRAQPDVAAYYDDEFQSIVADRVVETAKALASEKPHLAKPNTAPPPSSRPIEGLRSGAMPETKPAPASWSAVIRGG